MTARFTSLSNSPCSAKNASARCFSSRSTNAEISGGVNSLSPTPMRSAPFAADAEREMARLFPHVVAPLAHEELHGVDGALRVGQEAALRLAPDVRRAAFVERDDRRHQAVALPIANDQRHAVLDVRDQRVGGAEIDADDCAHACRSRSMP